MRYKIKFTLVGSDQWLETRDSCKIWSEAQMDERIAKIIGMKLKCQNINGLPQEVKLYSENDDLIGETDDIRKIGTLKLYIKDFPS